MSSIDVVNKIFTDDDSVDDRSVEGSSEVVRSWESTKSEVKESEALPQDVIFGLLKNQRRRRVLRYLKENQKATLSDIAEHVAALENGTEVEQLTSSERKRVYVGLYQCHLPRMDDAGVIEFDADRGVAEIDDRAEQLERYLDMSDRRWPLYYAGIAFVGTVAYVLGWLVLEATVLSTLAPVAVTIAVFVCALLHYRSDAHHATL